MKLPANKYLYGAAAALLFLFLLYFAFFRESPVTVEAGVVSVGELVSSIDAEGKTRYHDRFVVNAPISGKMYRITLHEGDRVPKGYVLTRIDPSPPRPLDPNSMPDTGVYPFAYNVYVPENGILTKIFVASEGIVQSGTPIAEISKPSKLEIVTDVLSADATKINPKMPVIVENWGGEGPLKATVRTIEPKAFTKVSSLGVEEQRVNVIADFDSPPERLGDDFRIDVRIVLWSGNDVLRVPASSLFREGDDWMVFVIAGSRARARKVVIGHRSPSYVQVLEGLAEGENVVLHPPNSVKDGTRIKNAG